MRYDAHIHMLLDGEDWRAAIARHKTAPDEGYIRAVLARYRAWGVTHLRDGGDRWGVCTRAARLAGEYGIDYKTPAFPIYKAGCYGSFIGRGYEDLSEYGTLVERAACEGADFIKIMVSGIMDFDRFGVITGEPYAPEDIRELIRIAHAAGFRVMAHANGARTVQAAAEAGVDSVEHGAYLDEAALRAMAEHGTLWTPTIVTIGNLIGCGRYPDDVLRPLFRLHAENIRQAAAFGVPIAVGSDAGAYRVLHAQGAADERRYLEELLGRDAEALRRGEQAMDKWFT